MFPAVVVAVAVALVAAYLNLLHEVWVLQVGYMTLYYTYINLNILYTPRFFLPASFIFAKNPTSAKRMGAPGDQELFTPLVA